MMNVIAVMRAIGTGSLEITIPKIADQEGCPNFPLGSEGLKLHILHWPHMDSIDLNPRPILGMGSDND
jgi:hypothetical protein